ncbi:putative integral membrane protein (TIGR02587 family) [Nocardiopsis arvandica]|uniref:Putative integral membrane protein (TIGR02587 family) n=1 Tax=Nocardiopsis sinuspersici TaxID=501010 RepID=A0A7Y9XC39_9ACTN|nr:putative integral membrane protein (TIGR02587 family) [Nocardiopsis sinuspersici]
MTGSRRAAGEGTRQEWREAGRDVARAVSGGMVVGIPLLYTMESWWAGANVSPPYLLAGLLACLVPVFLLVFVTGFWSRPPNHLGGTVMQTVQAVGISYAVAGVVLFALARVTWSMPLADAVGRLTYEAIPFALGAGLASTMVGGSSSREPQDQENGHRHPRAEATVKDIGITAVGAVVIGMAIAPTDEIPLLVAGVGGIRLLVVIALSLVVSYMIVFASGFLDERKRRAQRGVLQHPVTETVTAYLVSLLVSAVMLALFQNLALDAPLEETVARIVVLGFPAAIGGGAGRLVVG